VFPYFISFLEAVYSVDMSAAFDLLRVEKLDLGTVPVALENIVKNFLTNRKAFVSVGGEHSLTKFLRAGVPQGSVLGPKLFSIYTNGLSEVLKENESIELVIYADDSCIVCSAPTKADLTDLVNSTVAKHMDWLRQAGMVVNASKTELIYFRSNDVLTVELEGKPVTSSTTLNVLGMTFDCQMSWETQLSRSIQSCQRLKPALRALKKKLSSKELIQVITSHYYSRLYYGAEVWYPCLTKRLRDKISAVHHYPLRLVLNDFKRSLSRKTLAKRTNKANPDQLVNLKTAKCFISICTNCSPFTLFHELLSHAVIENRRPRRPWFLDMSRKRIGRQSFANRVGNLSKSLQFDWLTDEPLSNDSLRRQLKKTFFT